MERIEMLMQQKKRIEQEIEDIKAGEQSITVGKTMFDKKVWPTGKTEWRVRINVPIKRYSQPENHFNVVLKTQNREQTITELDKLIKDLTMLRQQIKEKRND